VDRIIRQCRTVIVPELNMGQMSREVKRVNDGHSRIRTLNRIDGQIITPAEILKLLQKA
jgi:2-oxoglutarate/2-oxoacid ferredoxin oxidoreductase subunit alpha